MKCQDMSELEKRIIDRARLDSPTGLCMVVGPWHREISPHIMMKFCTIASQKIHDYMSFTLLKFMLRVRSHSLTYHAWFHYR